MGSIVPRIGQVIEVKYFDHNGDWWVAANVHFRYAACEHGHDIFSVTCEECAGKAIVFDPYFRWEAIDLVDDEISTGEAYMSEFGKTWRWPVVPYPSEFMTSTLYVHPIRRLFNAVKRFFLDSL